MDAQDAGSWFHAIHYTRRYCCRAAPFIYRTLVNRLSYVYDQKVGTKMRGWAVSHCVRLLVDFGNFLENLANELEDPRSHSHDTACPDCLREMSQEMDDLIRIVNNMEDSEIYLLIFVRENEGDREGSPLLAEYLKHKTDCGLERRWIKLQESNRDPSGSEPRRRRQPLW